MIKSWVESSKKWATQYGQIIIWTTLIFFAFDLLYWRIIRGYTPPVSYVPWPPAPDWVETLYTGRWALRALEAVGGVTVLYLEVIDQSLSRWLRATLENRIRLFMFIGVSAFLLGSYLIQPGNVGAGDAMAHIGTPWAIRESIKDGNGFAFWSNYAYFGHPFLQFYSTAYYYLVAWISFLTRNVEDAAELTLLILHIVSAYPMYLYVRQLTGSRVAGAAASLAWSGTFYRYHLLLIVGKLSVSPFIALLPLQLYLIERLATEEQNKHKLWAALALTLGAMVWTHKLYAAWAIAFGCIYVVTRLLDGTAIRIPLGLRRVILVVSAHLAGLVVALYEIVPTFAEQALVTIGGMLDRNAFGLPVVRLENVLIFKDSYYSDWFGGYVGNSILFFAVLAIFFIVISHYWKSAALVLQFAIAVFMTFTPAYFPSLFDAIFHTVPFGNLAYVTGTSPGLYLMILIAPASALTGVLVHLVGERLRSRVNQISRFMQSVIGSDFVLERVGVAICLVFLADLIPTSLWVNIKYPDIYSGDRLGRQPIWNMLRQSGDKTSRLYDLRGGYTNAFSVSMWSGQPGLLGQIPDAPNKIHTLAYHVITSLEADAKDRRLRSETLDLLYQLDIRYITTDSTVTRLDGAERVMQTGEAILWQTKHAPIIATVTPQANNVVQVNDANSVLVEIKDYALTNDLVKINFSLPQRAFVQLAYSAYPYQKVMLDGQTIQATPTALGLVGFWAEAGAHAVTVTPELSPLRQWTLAASAITIIILIAIIILPIRRIK